MSETTMIGKYVLVTTKHRGVFAGVLEEDGGEDFVVLTAARNCVYWSQSNHGFLGLAQVGPQEGSRVGPKVDRIKLYGVTSCTECTDEAREKWEVGPWS